MAELAKKMNFKNASGATTQAKLYSTASEAGSEYQTLKVDGVTAYVSVGATSDGNATSGRFKKSGTTKAYLKQGGIPYTEVSWTNPGTYTWTCPTGVTKVRVAVIAGGGGNSGADDEYYDENNYVYSATDSKFHNIIATIGQYVDGEHIPGEPNGRGGSTIGDVTIPIGTLTIEGVSGFGLDFDINSIGVYGSGTTLTAVNFYNTELQMGGVNLGGTGGKAVEYVDVVPGQTYEVVVGRCLDMHLSYGNGALLYSIKGTDGAVLIAYGGDIQGSDSGGSDSGGSDNTYTKVDFTSSGTFVVPEGITTIKISAQAGGGGGGGGSSEGTNEYRAGSGGGGGGYSVATVSVTPGNRLTVTVGSGGAGGAIDNAGKAGGASSVKRSFSTLVTASGGGKGYEGGVVSVTSGGVTTNSGGGVGGTGTTSNGSNGGQGKSSPGAGGAGGSGNGGNGGSGGKSNYSGSAGQSGWVTIEYGGDIK